MKSYQTILKEAKTKDIWGKKLPGNVEDYSAHKVGNFHVELYYDNSRTYDPWIAFVMGYGPVAHSQDAKEALQQGTKKVKSFSKSDIAKIEQKIAEYKKAGIIK
jgi:hypothetical protein